MGSRLVEVGTISITPEKGCSEFDEHLESCADQGETHLSMVPWVGDKIEHLQGKIGGERPASFPDTKDSRCGYTLMKRM